MNAYHNLRVQIQGETIPEVRELKVMKPFNDHARITFSALITPGRVDTYLESFGSNTSIEVFQVEGKDSNCLFRGVITDISIQAEQEVYSLRVDGASYTWQLDRQKKRRSFQNKEATLQELLKAVIAQNAGADCVVNKNMANQKMNRMTLQYQETDWEVAKRIAAGFKAGLIADAIAGKPRFGVGLPEGTEPQEMVNPHYSMGKSLDGYREAVANQIQGASEQDFIVYEVQVGEVYQVGEMVRFQGKKWVVGEAASWMEDGVLKHRYVIVPENGLRQIPFTNPLIAGLALEGRVSEVERDRVKVLLEIDGGSSGAERWFSYATAYAAQGHTGWYCMPEADDAVKLYFPTTNEEEAYVIGSMRRQEKEGERLQDPATKYFRTANGATNDAVVKEAFFKEHELRMTLSGKDDTRLMVQMDDNKGVIISSDQGIEINAKQDIGFKSEQKLSITAAEEIAFESTAGKISMNDITKIDGTKINREM